MARSVAIARVRVISSQCSKPNALRTQLAINTASTRLARLQALVGLCKALGGGWQFQE